MNETSTIQTSTIQAGFEGPPGKPEKIKCRDCGGTGKRNGSTCPQCSGTGWE